MPIYHENIISFTDDQLHWLRVALENSMDSAKRLADSDQGEDVHDGLLLMEKYNELQALIGSTDGISLNPDE